MGFLSDTNDRDCPDERIRSLDDTVVGKGVGRVLHEGGQRHTSVADSGKPSALEMVVPSESTVSSGSILSLPGRTFLSERQYTRYLEARIEQAGPDIDKEYVRR